MYQIENKSDIFVEHYVGRFRRTYKIDRIGTEKNLIVYLANGFKSFSYYDSYDNWNDYSYMEYGNSRFAEHFFDGYGRDINGYAYKKDAWTYYCQYIRGKETKVKKDYSYWRRKLQYTQQHDRYKNQWCKDNNISLIRIPYTKYDNLSINMLIKS